MRKASWILCAALLSFNTSTFAQEQFSTPKAAVEALVAAAKAGDQGAILKVLGSEGKPIVSSGDPVADSNIRQNFISAYDAKHAIEMEGDGTRTLIIDGSSTRRQGSTKSYAGASAATSFPQSKSLSLMSRHKTNMPRLIPLALAEVCMRSGS